MGNNVVKSLWGAINENLPAILTGCGIATGVATVGYSIYAGWKLNDIVKDEKLSKKEKAKKVVKTATPAILGTAVTITCHVAAHEELASRYLAVAAVAGASKLDNNAIKDEVKNFICDKKDDNKKEEKSDKVVMPPQNEEIDIHDCITGHHFKTNLMKFYSKVNEWNNIGEAESWSMNQFYEDLEGERFTNYAEMYDNVIFGVNTNTTSFRPEFGVELGMNNKPVYTITYPYSTSENYN